MPRVHTGQMTSELTEQPTGLQWLWTATISHPNGDTSLYMVANRENVYVLGNLYLAVGFQIDLPEDKTDGIPTGKITIANVNQWLTPLIRNMKPPMTDPQAARTLDAAAWIYVEVAKVSAGDSGLTCIPARDSSVPKFDYVEEIYGPYQLSSVQYDAQKVQGTLTREYVFANQLQADTFNPFDFPALS